MIVLHETGQVEAVECIRTVVAATSPAPPLLLRDNPLGKIPTLVLEDGTCLFDSGVICEYLDQRRGGGLLPAGANRFVHLRWQALGDGLTETMLLLRTELQRQPPHPGLVENYRIKLQTGLAALDGEAPKIVGSSFGLGHIAILCALGQLDFRFGGSRWQEAFPALAQWYGQSLQRPSLRATVISDDGSQVGVDTADFLDFTQGS